MTTRQLKNRCRVIQSILDSPNFYPSLCAKADNDINKVVALLSKIINYILNSNEEKIDLDNLETKENGDFVIFPTNSYYYQQLSLFGLSFFALNGKINDQLNNLESALSYYSVDSRNNWFSIYNNVEEAID